MSYINESRDISEHYCQKIWEKYLRISENQALEREANSTTMNSIKARVSNNNNNLTRTTHKRSKDGINLILTFPSVQHDHFVSKISYKSEVLDVFNMYFAELRVKMTPRAEILKFATNSHTTPLLPVGQIFASSDWFS